MKQENPAYHLQSESGADSVASEFLESGKRHHGQMPMFPLTNSTPSTTDDAPQPNTSSNTRLREMDNQNQVSQRNTTIHEDNSLGKEIGSTAEIGIQVEGSSTPIPESFATHSIQIQHTTEHTADQQLIAVNETAMKVSRHTQFSPQHSRSLSGEGRTFLAANQPLSEKGQEPIIPSTETPNTPQPDDNAMSDLTIPLSVDAPETLPPTVPSPGFREDSPISVIPEDELYLGGLREGSPKPFHSSVGNQAHKRESIVSATSMSSSLGIEPSLDYGRERLPSFNLTDSDYPTEDEPPPRYVSPYTSGTVLSNNMFTPCC